MIDFLRLPSLHLGPMSCNVIDATVNFAKTNNWPICLIASRRQIDSKKMGGGYVGNLTTESFAERLKAAIADGYIILARDHGGPYQRSEESGLTIEEAINRAESSYQADIESGFNIIHIDPEKCIKESDPKSLSKFTELTKELLSRCFAILDHTGRNDVRFEVGTDEGVGMQYVPEQWESFLRDITEYCAAKERPNPIAIAVPLGTKVKETENVGGLVLNTQDPFYTKHVQVMQKVSSRFGLKLKLHNADYISTDVLRKYLELGVEQLNVAPELGVLETRALLEFLDKNNMADLKEKILEIAYSSREWERWLKPGTTASDKDKAIIAGHYVFSTQECQEIFKKIKSQYNATQFDSFLKNAISQGIEKYYSLLGKTYAPVKNIS